MSEKPVKDDAPQEESANPADDLRAKFLVALNKKQGAQRGGAANRSGAKSGSRNTSEGHTQRMFQRKSGAS